MATRLYPNTGSQNMGKNSIKLKIDCKNRISENPETKDWLELVHKFNHKSSEVKVYRALLEKRKNIVAKIGKNNLDQEYEVGRKLEEIKLPTFIQFSCIFSCLDNFSKLNTTVKEVCKDEGKPVSIILMPYISEGRIDKWAWERSNFELMKNVIKHVFMTLFYAKTKIGFIHRDLHLGNVLLKKTTRNEISYGEYGTLEVNGFLPIIMDFDKSVFIEKYDRYFYEDLNNFISLMSNSCNVKFNSLLFQSILLDKIKSDTSINMEDCVAFCKYIDKLEISYVSSELPQMPVCRN